ncbi:MAG TPA: pantoate--beta-alanine ligase [Pilimelia sp.]|nr:pantoate--beta-alanine ligase [Pilimelia sp.]
MRVVGSRAELAAARDALPGTVAVVMTMGALHAGHEALLRAARERADSMIVTVFVNPLQFGPNEDFDRYPRTWDADLAMCREVGVDLVFAPERAEMYPAGEPTVRVNPGPLGERLEGASRPGFFHGVLTVVLKLLHLTRPHLAFFGEKDYQQLTLVRRMVGDLDVPVEIIGVPTVREPDGLALSSRNRYLSTAERLAALRLSAALQAGAAAAGRGAGADGSLAAARAAFDEGTAVLTRRSRSSAEGYEGAGSLVPDGPRTGAFASDAAGDSAGPKLDYLVLTAPDLGPPPAHGPARMLVAAWVGTTRLIDNAPLDLRTGP